MRFAYAWGQKVENYFRQEIFAQGFLPLGPNDAAGIFVPIVPLFDGSAVQANEAPRPKKSQLQKSLTKVCIFADCNMRFHRMNKISVFLQGFSNIKAMISVGSGAAAVGDAPREGGLATLPLNIQNSERPLLAGDDLEAMLEEHKRSLAAKVADLDKVKKNF